MRGGRKTFGKTSLKLYHILNGIALRGSSFKIISGFGFFQYLVCSLISFKGHRLAMPFFTSRYPLHKGFFARIRVSHRRIRNVFTKSAAFFERFRSRCAYNMDKRTLEFFLISGL